MRTVEDVRRNPQPGDVVKASSGWFPFHVTEITVHKSIIGKFSEAGSIGSIGGIVWWREFMKDAEVLHIAQDS